jgi:hypothetical protein
MSSFCSHTRGQQEQIGVDTVGLVAGDGAKMLILECQKKRNLKFHTNNNFSDLEQLL